MKTNIFLCPNKCCQIKIKPYVPILPTIKRFPTPKAGIFIYDPKTNKILMVQSNGNLWGIPKGSLQQYESFLTCAIREVYEETGLIINKTNISKAITIYNNCKYFYTQQDYCNVNVQNNPNNNDANGIAWLNVDCLQQCIKNGTIAINSHCRILFHKFLHVYLPKNNK